jgi:hypothetical protein
MLKSLVFRNLQIKWYLNHFSPIRMVRIKIVDSSGIGKNVEKTTFMHCQWECKMVKQLWKTVLLYRVTISPCNSTLRYIPKRSENIKPH